MVAKQGFWGRFLSLHFVEKGGSARTFDVTEDQELDLRFKALDGAINVLSGRLKGDDFEISDVNPVLGTQHSLYDNVNIITGVAKMLEEDLERLQPYMNVQSASVMHEKVNHVLEGLKGLQEDLPRYSNRMHVKVSEGQFEGNITDDINTFKDVAFAELELASETLKKRSNGLKYVGHDLDHPLSSGISVQ